MTPNHSEREFLRGDPEHGEGRRGEDEGAGRAQQTLYLHKGIYKLTIHILK